MDTFAARKGSGYNGEGMRGRLILLLLAICVLVSRVTGPAVHGTTGDRTPAWHQPRHGKARLLGSARSVISHSGIALLVQGFAHGASTKLNFC